MNEGSIVVGMLAGTGIYQMAEKIITKIVESPYVKKLVVLTPRNKVRDYNFITYYGNKIDHINHWTGPDSHDYTGTNREVIRLRIKRILCFSQSSIDWIWIGDDDALPADNFFEVLSTINYGFPVLLTGRTNNLDGTRWYDICSFLKNGFPFCVPYDDWQNPRWAKDLYASGNQHIMNFRGFDLDIPYPAKPGEDPHYCWMFRRAGGRLLFEPRLSVTLQKQHPEGNYGTPESELPDAILE